ncbi:MAG TPA: twin-arginine translocase TatA/TatE family subunit [Pirellulales bacterium]|nr:twin-arginine translocase TatA/TatE family subunit [Pirellulales bacterium]
MLGLSPVEVMVIGVVAVLLFGSNLPSVARSMGKSMSQFKKGMQDLKDELNVADSRPQQIRRYHEIDDRDEPTAPKFEPPTAEPSLEEPTAEAPALAESRTAEAPVQA